MKYRYFYKQIYVHESEQVLNLTDLYVIIRKQFVENHKIDETKITCYEKKF